MVRVKIEAAQGGFARCALKIAVTIAIMDFEIDSINPKPARPQAKQTGHQHWPPLKSDLCRN